MLNHLASLPTYTQIAVWIILSLMLTCMLMILMHRMILFDVRQKHNDVIGGSQALIEISKLVSAYEPMTRKEFTYFDALIKELDETYDARRDRVFRASEGIAPEVWTVTLAGGLITLCFAVLFGVESQGMHLLLASMLAVAIALILALILIFDTPFAGGISVSDQPYRLVLKQIESYER